MLKGFAAIGAVSLLFFGFQNCAKPNSINPMDQASADGAACWSAAGGTLIETCNASVGIGTVSPKAKLQVSGGTTILQQEGWTSVTFLNSWTNYGGSYAPAGFFKDSTGVVHLRGLVMNGSPAACVFNLPAGYRPGYRAIFTTMRYNSTQGEYAGRLDVDVSGCVSVPGNPYTNGYLSLEGVSFLAEQ